MENWLVNTDNYLNHLGFTGPNFASRKQAFENYLKGKYTSRGYFKVKTKNLRNKTEYAGWKLVFPLTEPVNGRLRGDQKSLLLRPDDMLSVLRERSAYPPELLEELQQWMKQQHIVVSQY
jgi:hypothetical protein